MMTHALRRYALTLVVTGLCLCAAGPAPAEEPLDLLVVNVSGPLAGFDPAETVMLLLPSHGARAVPRSAVDAFTRSPAGAGIGACQSADCMAQTARELKAPYAVTLRHMARGEVVMISMFLIDAASGAIVQRGEQTAAVERVSVAAAVESLTAALLADLHRRHQNDHPVVLAPAPVPPAPATPAQPPQPAPAQPAPVAAAPVKPAQPAQPPQPVAAQPAPADQNKTEAAPATPGEPAAEQDQRASSAAKLKVKGDLTNIGPLNVVIHRNRAGVAIGYRQIFATHYAYIAPALDMHFFDDTVAFGLEVPLNLEIFNGRIDLEAAKAGHTVGFGNAGHPRSQDWDEWRDYFRVIRYIRYGTKEDKLYLHFAREAANTLGHGFLVRRYLNNWESSSYRVSMAFDGYNDWGGFQLYTNDVTNAGLVGGLAFFKPGALLSDNFVARSLSFGLEAVFDRAAPIYTHPSEVDNYGRLITLDSGYVLGLGGDVELKVARGDHVDAKLYAANSYLLPMAGEDPSARHKADLDDWYPGYQDYSYDGGWGANLGTLIRMNYGGEAGGLMHAMRLRLEFRAYSRNFEPSYFDSLYEIQKYKYISSTTPGASPNAVPDMPRDGDPESFVTKPGSYASTKYARVFSRSSAMAYGGMVEFSYSLMDYFAMTVALEASSATDSGKMILHAEVPALDWLTLAATYYKWSFSGFENVFDLTESNAMIISAARIHPLPLFYINLGFRKTLQASDKYWGKMDDEYAVNIDLEISYEWDEKDKKKAED